MRLASKTRDLLASVGVPVILLCGAAVASAQDKGREVTGQFDHWLPPDISTHGHEIDFMFNLILYLTGATCIAVFAAMLWFLIKYRYNPKRHATFIHGNNKLETVWTLIPTLIMALIAAFSQKSWSAAKYADAMPDGSDVVHVNVIGKQFKWYFHYPGADGKFGPRRRELVNLNASEEEKIIGLDRKDAAAKDDVVTSVMVAPVGHKIRIVANSVDVIHSFFLPNFRVKQDAVPGLNSNIWFEATKTSEQVIGSDPANPLKIVDSETNKYIAISNSKPFDIVCAELCGQGHYTMRGLLYVVTQPQYEKWMEVAQKNVKIAAEENE